MTESELLVLVFAPATVGLVVMSVRRLPSTIYLASLFGVIALTFCWGPYSPGVDGPTMGELFFAAAFVVLPTIAAFVTGRLIALRLGGAYVFTASSTAYVMGLAFAAGIATLSQELAF